MKNFFLIVLLSNLLFACMQGQNKQTGPTTETSTPKDTVLWQPYDDSAEVAANADHEKEKMRYKFIQSKVLDKNEVFLPLYEAVSQFPMEKYEQMLPLVMEADIPTIQGHITNRSFTYKDLVLFYLHRIYTYELPNETTLNTIIALNPKVLEQAGDLDDNAQGHHPIYGMPILLKDNIGATPMNTTTGAVALLDNTTEDAFIVSQLRKKGALVLGKVNLSEWANFLCDCPNGQSAVGGQTLNPYGRRVFDTGGSSAGSGSSVAANYAVAAVGTETSGSILSPSGQHSVVGMKPTIGVLSRTGIVPISSTLDTPGPMTKNVTDNRILLDAMRGIDGADAKSVQVDWPADWYRAKATSLNGKRFGVFKNYMKRDSLYKTTVLQLKAAGATIIEFEPPSVNFDGFLSILNIDMKNDLPSYIDAQTKINKLRTVADFAQFNRADSAVRIPYGQTRFDGILSDATSSDELVKIKKRLQANGRNYFETPMQGHQLDAILSINNYDAGAAAAAEYPALTVPMGYRVSGEPVNLTFIGKPFQETKLYELGAGFEALTKARKPPMGYQR